MKKTAIVAGIVVAAFIVRALRKGSKPTMLEEKVHDLQDHFKSLDAEVSPG